MWVLVCWRLLQNVYVGGGVLATSSEAVDVLEGLQSVYVSVGVFATCKECICACVRGTFRVCTWVWVYWRLFKSVYMGVGVLATC